MDKVYTNVEIQNPVVNLLVVTNCLTNILWAKDSLSWRSLPLSCTTLTPGHDVSGKCGVCGDPLPIIVRRATWLSRVLSLPYRVTTVTIITTAPPLTSQKKNRHFYFFFVGAFSLTLLVSSSMMPLSLLLHAHPVCVVGLTTHRSWLSREVKKNRLDRFWWVFSLLHTISTTRYVFFDFGGLLYFWVRKFYSCRHIKTNTNNISHHMW